MAIGTDEPGSPAATAPRPTSPGDVVGAVAAWARACPLSVAIDDGRQGVTFQDLQRNVDLVATMLAEGRPDVRSCVGILAPVSATLITSILGALKAGRPFVALDPDCPPDRLRAQLLDAEVSELLVPRDLQAIAASLSGPWKMLDPAGPPVGVVPPKRRPPPARSALAYVAYTSGTTGAPKGVAVPVMALRNVLAQAPSMGLGRASRLVTYYRPGFDATLFGMLAPLLVGGAVCVADRDVLLEPRAAAAFMRDRQVDALQISAAALAQLSPESVPRVSLILIGGEVYPERVVRRWHRTARILNLYGPTETTIFSAFTEIGPDTPLNLLGAPIANTRIHLVDDALAPVGPDEPGEICISGRGLAIGYLNRPRETALAFIPDTGGTPGRRCYRTGDYGRLRSDGRLLFLGRRDQQVKRHGFRMELGETETAAERHPAISEAAALFESPSGRITLFFVSVEQALPPADLREFLARRLPHYMLPDVYRQIPALPRTERGKIDREALRSWCPADPRGGSGPDLALVPEPEDLPGLAAMVGRVLEEHRGAAGAATEQWNLTSMESVAVGARLNEAFGTSLRMTDVLRTEDLASLTALVRSAREEVQAAGAVRQGEDAMAAVRGATPTERDIWLDGVGGRESSYNLAFVLHLRADVGLREVLDAWMMLMARQPILRTRFSWVDTELRVRVDDDNAVECSWLASDASDRSVVAEVTRPFQLEGGPLVRLAILDGRSLLVMVHHLVFDGASLAVVTKLLAEAVEAVKGGTALERGADQDEATRLAEEYRRRRNDLERSAIAATQASFWHTVGAELSATLKTERQDGQAGASRGIRAPVELGANIWRDVQAAAARLRTSPFILIFCAVAKATWPTNAEAHCVGTVVSQRVGRAGAVLAGCMVNTIPIPLSGDPAAAPSEWMPRWRDRIMACLSSSDLTHSEIEKAVASEVGDRLGRPPVFLSFWREPALADGGVIREIRYVLPAAPPRWPVYFELREGANGVRGVCEVDSRFYSDLDAGRLSAAFLAALGDLTREGERDT